MATEIESAARLSAGLMTVGALALPWLGLRVSPSDLSLYAWQSIPLGAAAGISVLSAWGTALTRPPSVPRSDARQPQPHRPSMIAALTGLAAVASTVFTTEVLSSVAVGRRAAWLVDQDSRVRLVAGPGMLVFLLGVVGLAITASGRVPLSTASDWLATRPVAGWQLLVLAGGLGLVYMGRSEEWLRLAANSFGGSEIPLLSPTLSVLCGSVALCVVWLVVRGGLLPRFVGGMFGLLLGLVALTALVATPKVVELVPVDDLETRGLRTFKFDQGDDAVRKLADIVRDSGTGYGPTLVLLGLASIAVAAAWTPTRRGNLQGLWLRPVPSGRVAPPGTAALTTSQQNSSPDPWESIDGQGEDTSWVPDSTHEEDFW